MMIKLQKIELIKGVRVGMKKHVLHLQFEDDTIVFIEVEDNNVK